MFMSYVIKIVMMMMMMTVSLAFKSRLAFSIGVCVTSVALISRRNDSEKCHMYYNGKARHNLNASGALFLYLVLYLFAMVKFSS